MEYHTQNLTNEREVFAAALVLVGWQKGLDLNPLYMVIGMMQAVKNHLGKGKRLVQV